MSVSLRSVTRPTRHICLNLGFLSRGRAYTTTTKTTPNTLNWSDYLTIRRAKRRWQLITTIPCIVIGFGGGAAYFGSVEADASKPIFGIDPLYAYAFATIACGGFGYLMGPTIGNVFWRVTHGANLRLIEARDREFYNHIVKNRANPAAQSATNPVPDYYGEKVGSLHQYRQWLRDQSKYKKKARWLEEE